MRELYLDNGATSYPKPPGMSSFIADYIDNIGTSIGRGAYSKALSAEGLVYDTREKLAELFNFDIPENVVFTKNITESLNLFIQGFLKGGDHVIVGPLEHNALMRPLCNVEGLSYDMLSSDLEGNIDIEEAFKLVRPSTKAILISHASNVCGTSINIKRMGEIALSLNLPLILDSAQSAGILDIDMKEHNISFLGFTGHKSLLGPQGIGGFLIDKALVDKLPPFILGGTGSKSELLTQPQVMPDKYESGTPNMLGIYGLHYSLDYISNIGIDGIREHELNLCKRLLDGLLEMDGLDIIGRKDILNRTGVLSLDFRSIDNAEASYLLSKEFGISNRCGLHCAPSAHKSLNTFPRGTVRISPGYFNTKADIDYTIDSINKILKG